MNTRLFQLHLERIANYLSIGDGKWWHHNIKTNEIVFHDVEDCTDNITHPVLLNFRDTTMTEASKIVSYYFDRQLHLFINLAGIQFG